MQKTIQKEVTFKGIGLHTGNICKVTFKPALANTGVVITRIDLPGAPNILANYQNVVSVIRGTTVGNESMRVHTIEHMLSAVYALQIDNLFIDMDANEPPVADGSSCQFFDLLLNDAKIQEQEGKRAFLKPNAKLEYKNESGETQITLEPSDTLKLTTIVAFNHPMIQRQEVSATIETNEYRKEISPARTFCFDYEVEALKKQGLAKGGSLDNAVVVGLDRIHNKEKQLRFPNEFARHKALDLLGDLYLLGMPIQAHITALRPGHGHNINFVKQIAATYLTQKEGNPHVHYT